jgi:hypothetical protein
MLHAITVPKRRNRRAFVATLLSYLLLATQVVPLVAASPRAARSKQAADAAAPAAKQIYEAYFRAKS